jgi:hypothetical protein
MAMANKYACFECCSLGGGLYTEYEGETVWWLGLDALGQAHYSCDDCKVFLFSPVLADMSTKPAAPTVDEKGNL